MILGWGIISVIICMIAVACMISAPAQGLQISQAKKTKTFNLYVTLTHGTTDSGGGKVIAYANFIKNGKNTSTKVSILNLKNHFEGDIQHLIKFPSSKIKGVIDMTTCFFSKNVKFMNCGYTHDINPSDTKASASIDLLHLSVFSNRCEYNDSESELQYNTECVNIGLGNGGGEGNGGGDTGNEVGSISVAPGSSVPSNGQFFVPEKVTISNGGTVIWTNDDDSLHTVTSGSPEEGNSGTEFDSPYIVAGKTFEHTFNNKGTFDYYCILHPYMKGKIVVN